MRRYQNLMIREALSKNHLYPLACNELSSILNVVYCELSKSDKGLIFEDTLSAFRLLPEMNTSAAVSAANLLVKRVEAVFPKQKKNLAIVEFKQARVALKRRIKSQEKDTDVPPLPQDILIHIFSFLDVSSLLSSSQVSRSWNLATSDVSLWRSLYHLYFNHKVVINIEPSFDWRKAFQLSFNDSVEYSSSALKSGRGYCSNCDTFVWHHNLRCPNKQCCEPLDLISTQHVVNYLLGILSSSDESESEDEAIPGLWAYPTL